MKVLLSSSHPSSLQLSTPTSHANININQTKPNHNHNHHVSKHVHDFFNQRPMSISHIRTAPVSIAVPSNPIEPDTSTHGEFSIETMRELEIVMGIGEPEPDNVEMPQDQLLDALRQAFREYKYRPLSALNLRLGQPGSYIKETVEKIAVLIPGSDSGDEPCATYQLKAEAAE